jgi:hypothetical protein
LELGITGNWWSHSMTNLAPNVIALLEVRWAMEGTEPTKNYTFLYVKDMNM